MHLTAPVLLSAVLAGIGAYGVLARRNAVLVLIGVELLLSSANVLLVAMSTQERPYVLSETTSVAMYGGQVMTIFIITLAAAEIVVALAIVLAMFRVIGHIDVTAAPEGEVEPATDEPVAAVASAGDPGSPAQGVSGS